MNTSLENKTLQLIAGLSADAKMAFAAILSDSDLCDLHDISGVEELREHDLVNEWEDDTGRKYIEIGRQL